jgi:hypothetical protein
MADVRKDVKKEIAQVGELARSITRLSWALSLLGVKQIENLISANQPSQSEAKAAAAFSSITKATTSELGERSEPIFQVGDQQQRLMLDLMHNLLTPQSFTPRGLVKMGFDVTQQSAEVVRLLAPWRESRCALQEFQNKLEAFNLFAHVDLTLHIESPEEGRLPELIKKTEALDSYRAVWATEGLGYYLATKFCERSGAPRSLLNGERGGKVPERSLVALHAGMGLAIANRLMATISSGSQKSKIRHVLDQFATDCRDNSRMGYTGAAYESLGLVTRNLYPQMIPKLDPELRQIDENLAGYFWHGVGRGIYFAPTNFFPDGNSLARALKMARQEPPHELGRRNALAGLTWAMTLINIRNPEILESFLKNHGSQLGDRDAFSNGVGSSVMIWRDSTVADDYLREFLRHHPSDTTVAARWEQMIRRPCTEALENVYPVLKARGRLGECFHYMDLSAQGQ